MMRTLKTAPMFWVEKMGVLETGNAVLCDSDQNTKLLVDSFEDEAAARNLVNSLNAAAYRWAISEDNT